MKNPSFLLVLMSFYKPDLLLRTIYLCYNRLLDRLLLKRVLLWGEIESKSLNYCTICSSDQRLASTFTSHIRACLLLHTGFVISGLYIAVLVLLFSLLLPIKWIGWLPNKKERSVHVEVVSRHILAASNDAFYWVFWSENGEKLKSQPKKTSWNVSFYPQPKEIHI